MNTIEQAREVSIKLKAYDTYVEVQTSEAAEIIDWLIAENTALLVANRDCVDWFENLKLDYDKVQAELADYTDPPKLQPQPVQAQESYTTLPERDTTKPAEQQGLFKKFMVKRVDDSDDIGGKHYGCEYFVLDVDHDQHAPNALRAYATACAETHPKLSADLKARWGAQERKPLTDDQITEVWRELRAQKEDWSDLDFARAIEAYIKEQPAPVQAGAQPTVTCQIYGHVVGACAECNTHNEVGAQPVPSSKYPCKLTDAELADPEYMRSYIEAMNQDYADLLYAQPVQQEPVMQHCPNCNHEQMALSVDCGNCGNVYDAAPMQAQERKPLTDDQITEVWRELREQKGDWSDLDFARAIEAKIKEQT